MVVTILFSYPGIGVLARMEWYRNIESAPSTMIPPKLVATEGAFGGGIGEDQFASFLTRSYAETLAAQLDLGLAKGMDPA